MAKNEISDYDETDSGNTDISGIGLSDATLIDQLDNIARAQMGALKRWFKSSLFRLRDSTDQTKLLAFDLSGLSTETTRTLKVADTSGSILVTGSQTFTQAEKGQIAANIGQAWELIGKFDLVASTGINVIGIGEFDQLRITHKLRSTGASANIMLRPSTDGGTSFAGATNDYMGQIMDGTSAGTVTAAGLSGHTGIALASVVSDQAGPGITYLDNFGLAGMMTYRAECFVLINTTNLIRHWWGYRTAQNNGFLARNALRIAPDIAVGMTGRIIIEGVRK